MLDIPNERFDDKNSMDGTDAYSRLSDQAEDEAYDGLTEHIQDALPLVDAQDYLIKIATIWQQRYDATDVRDQMAEKYALIGDLFQGIVDRIAAKNSRFD